MSFVFVSSALASASGLGLAAAPVAETATLQPLALVAGLSEVGLSKLMQERMGMVKEAYHEGKAGKYIRAAEIFTAAGAVLAGTSGRSRTRAALGGTALLLGSALTRFGIFEAGINSARDPRYTVVPQRERAASRG
jgi:hypothetical protein